VDCPKLAFPEALFIGPRNSFAPLDGELFAIGQHDLAETHRSEPFFARLPTTVIWSPALNKVLVNKPGHGDHAGGLGRPPPFFDLAVGALTSKIFLNADS